MKTFLIPIDFSDISYNSAQYGLDIAGFLNAQQVIFYHSYRETPKGLLEIIDEENAYQRASVRHIERMVQKLTLPHNIRQEQLVYEADDRPVIDGIEHLAETHAVSLVIMGISGLSDVDSTLIGQHTLGVASSAPAPLLIVPRNHRFLPIRKIVYATDLREVETTTPVDGITRLAKQLHAETHIIHVDHGAQSQSPDSKRHQQQLLAFLQELDPVFEIVDQHRDKAYGIFDYVKQHEINLILMASRNYGFFERIFHNSVSKKLLNIVDVPVVLLKNRARIV